MLRWTFRSRRQPFSAAIFTIPPGSRPRESRSSLGRYTRPLASMSRYTSFIEMGDLSPEAIEAYVTAATDAMPREKQIKIAARLLAQARKGVTP